jgi:hypothetical protein
VSAANSAALLIDADNISDSEAIEGALANMHEQGWRLTVRRAYGGYEKLAGLKDCLLRHGIRALVNQGKGTTDALLCVDVMDLLHTAELPDIVAIASSDADFAPLAVRLREAGIRVICFAQSGKAAKEELAKVYEQVFYLNDEAPRSKPSAAPVARPTRKVATKKAAPPKPAAPQDPLRAALSAIAGFDEREWIPMNEVVKTLRDAKLLSKSATGPKFLAVKAPYVELAPATQPNKVRLKVAAR